MAIHAHLAEQLIRSALGGDAALVGLPRAGENLWILGWALLGAALSLLVRSAIPAVIGAGSGLVCIGALSYVAFGRALWLPVLPAAVAWIASAGIGNQVLHAASNRARARLRRSFEHYLPPAVIDRLVKADALPSLGGERREITVLFTDVAGFTAFSESRDPEKLAEITNEYFDGLCTAVFAQEGLVNAFIGDGVLAFFGAPQEQPDHADRAVSAALGIDRFAQQFSRDQKARGIDFGHTRIGIHTGDAFVGHVGARQRLQYTALGDILNTCSRLEGLNKTIGTRICVSREVVEKCCNHLFRPVGEFVVVGRRATTDVYVPVNPDRDSGDAITRYESAYQTLDADPREAAERFAELHRQYPDDACIAFHHDRLLRGERGKQIEMDRK